MQTLTPGSILGHAVRRREDPRLVTGTGNYVDDTQPEGCLHIAFVRSTLAHATIRSLDVEAAAAAPGVVAVLTAADLGLPDRVGFPMVAATLARPPLATGRVRFVGDSSINGWRQCRWSLKRSWSCLTEGVSWSGRPARSRSGCGRRWPHRWVCRPLTSAWSSATWAAGSARRPAREPS